MSDGFFVIIVGEIDNTQRTLIHELVKSNSSDWWHDVPNVWIVKGGGTAVDWRNRIAPIVPLQPSAVVVLALKEKPGHRWAAKGAPFNKLAAWYKKALEEPPEAGQ